MASNLLEGKVFVKISELDPTVGFAAEDEFVLVQNGVTLKTTGLDITDSVISIGNLANKPYVDGKIIDLIDGAPGILDTLDELATALNDDANFAGTITTIVNTKLASGDFGLRFWEELAQVNTYHIAEGINLYWTQERFDTALAAKNTFHIAEGSNLYFTEQRVLDVVTPLVPTSIFDLGVPEVGTPENIPGYLYYNGTDLSWRAVDGGGSYPTAPTFSSVTTTQLNVQNVEFTGTGAVTISSGNDLNLSAVGNVSINGNTIGNLAYANNVSFTDILDVNGPTGPQKIAFGKDAGKTNQGESAIAIGFNAGKIEQESFAVAIGLQAGYITQGGEAVAIGESAGFRAQGQQAVAIGMLAGEHDQSSYAVAIGRIAGMDYQGQHAVAIGSGAGKGNQGQYAVAIGNKAGFTSQPSKTIILNATGLDLNGVTAQTDSLYIAPIRDTDATAKGMFYNTTTKEVTTATLAAVATSGSYTDLTNKPNIVEKTTGSWTLAAGANTVSLTVPINGTYSIWVNGNIPNGIVTYTATVVVTNTNVPVIGSSYGWYYADGNALVLTAIPTHIVGTANNISTYTVATTTANVFTFGITNNSGSDQVVNWGYTKL
jgi:hypothetical protein